MKSKKKLQGEGSAVGGKEKLHKKRGKGPKNVCFSVINSSRENGKRRKIALKTTTYTKTTYSPWRTLKYYISTNNQLYIFSDWILSLYFCYYSSYTHFFCENACFYYFLSWKWKFDWGYSIKTFPQGTWLGMLGGGGIPHIFFALRAKFFAPPP